MGTCVVLSACPFAEACPGWSCDLDGDGVEAVGVVEGSTCG